MILFGGPKIVKILLVKVDIYVHIFYLYTSSNTYVYICICILTTTIFTVMVTFGVLQVANEELIDVSWNGIVFGLYDLIHLWLTSSLSSTNGSSSS